MFITLIQTIKRSTFLRLFVIFLLSTIILIVMVASAAHFINDPHHMIKKKFQDNIISYSNLLVNKIGTPPNFEIAQTLSTKNSLQINIKSKIKSWKSANYNLPALDTSEQQLFEQNENIIIGHNMRYSYTIIKLQDYDFVIAFTHRKFEDSQGLFIISLIIIFISVTSLNYYLVRWLFRPLRLLDEGVKQIGEGNFDFQLNNTRKDELGELATAFNHMTEKISNMMKQKEQLLMDVSHELRSPMTRIKLALEFISNDKSKTSIQDDLQEMESMITELLESARLSNPNSALDKHKINLNRFLDSIAKYYEDSSPAVIFNKPRSDYSINIDSDRIQTCLRNIINNALKYSACQEEPVEITLQQSQNKIFISITDFGDGIPLQDQAHIFEPFYRVDKSRNSNTGGYGLGLNLCKKIIKAHAGEIIVKSTPGSNTRFTLILPMT